MNAGPTSLESLLRHRAATADAPPSRRVWLFHAHAYFDHEEPEQEAVARAFMERVRTTFASTAHVELNAFVPRPVGPHPHASFEVLFTREVFAEVLSWLMFERPPSLSVLVHPLTRSQAEDHIDHAVWLGPQLAIDRAFLERVDAQSAHRSEESIIDGTKKH